MKLTDLIGKQIYSLYEGEIIGTISGITFNNNITKIHAFKVFDQEENEFELLLNNIKAMHDCVIVANRNKLGYFIDSRKKSPMQKEVLNENAENLGKIIDVDVEQNGIIQNFITSKDVSLKPQNIYVRKDFVFYSTRPINISSFRPRKQNISNLSNIKVNILKIDDSFKNDSFAPSRIKYNPNTILGKVAKSDLFGTNNEIIIKANQIITEKIIDEASKHNRLNQLFFLSV